MFEAEVIKLYLNIFRFKLFSKCSDILERKSIVDFKYSKHCTQMNLKLCNWYFVYEQNRYLYMFK